MLLCGRTLKAKRNGRSFQGVGKKIEDEDLLLVQECVTGSEKAWREFYSRFIGLMRNVVRRQTGLSPYEVDDITQSAFLSLATGLRGYDATHSLTSFVCLVTERVLIDEYRKIKAVKRDAETEAIDHHDSVRDGSIMIASDVDPQDIQIEKYELASILREAVDRLDAGCRELLTLRYYHDLSFGEIAHKLGVVENTLNVRTRRCLDKLRAAYSIAQLSR
jgi:RNA polymerase sigma-70 factor (ECF subfamily)